MMNCFEKDDAVVLPKKSMRILDLKKCDLIKVAMMIAVMVYHCICLWSRGSWFNQPPMFSSPVLEFLCGYLNSIHIYVFTFVSGYLFYYSRYEKGKKISLGRDVLHRMKRLLLPYAVVAAVWVAPFYFYFFKPEYPQLLTKFLLAQSPGQLWFLVMLFVVFLLFSLIGDFLKKNHWIVGFLLCGALYIIGTLCSMKLPNAFQIWTALQYSFFFYLGFFFRRCSNNFLYHIPWFIYLIADIALFTVSFYFVETSIMTVMKLLALALKPIYNVLGVMTVVVGFSRLKVERLYQTRFFLFLKKHNFVMYLFHQQIIYISISLFNPYLATPLLVIVNILFSAIGSVLIALLLEKIPGVRTLFGYR